MLFGKKKERAATVLVDSTLNQYRPTLTRGPGDQWQLTVDLGSDKFVRAEFKSRTMKVSVLNGRTVHAARPANYEGLGVALNIPLQDVVTAIVERWRFLNLIVELH